MPININQIARTTGFQNNCGLNCISHALVRNIRDDRLTQEAKATLLLKFNEYYRSHLTWNEFSHLIASSQNPLHTEIVLGPVLRTMLRLDVVNRHLQQALPPIAICTPGTLLTENHLEPLANFFNIELQSYGRHPQNPHLAEQIDYLTLQMNPPVRPGFTVLKLWNENNNHYEYEAENHAAAVQHNAFYQQYPQFYSKNADATRNKLSQAFNAGQRNLLNILAGYEQEVATNAQSAKPAQRSAQNAFSGDIFGGFDFSSDAMQKFFQALGNLGNIGSDKEFASASLTGPFAFVGGLVEAFVKMFKTGVQGSNKQEVKATVSPDSNTALFSKFNKKLEKVSKNVAASHDQAWNQAKSLKDQSKVLETVAKDLDTSGLGGDSLDLQFKLAIKELATSGKRHDLLSRWNQANGKATAEEIRASKTQLVAELQTALRFQNAQSEKLGLDFAKYNNHSFPNPKPITIPGGPAHAMKHQNGQQHKPSHFKDQAGKKHDLPKFKAK